MSRAHGTRRRRGATRDDLHDFPGRSAPELPACACGPEIWGPDVRGVLREIDDTRAEGAERRLHLARSG